MQGLTPRACLLILAAAGAGAPLPARPQAFTEQAGVLEFSGQLIVLPVQHEPARAAAVARLDGLVEGHVAETGEYLVRPPSGMDENSYAALLLATGDYQYVHPNWRTYPARIPNDPNFPSQWYLLRIGAPQAWDRAVGHRGVTLAWVDTGVDSDHPDLQGHLVPGYNCYDRLEEAAGGVVEDEDTLFIPGGHGTHVAGLMGAAGDNGTAIAGVNWTANLMPVRTTGSVYSAPPPTLADTLDGVRWAADHGAHVINVSWTGVRAAAVQQTGAYARRRGALLVWAVDDSNHNYGSSFDHRDVVVVGATDQADLRASFSSFGDCIDLVAPGVDMISTRRMSGGGANTGSDNGTSYAAPLVAGAAALLRSHNPTLKPWDLENVLLETARDLGDPTLFGEGLLDLGAAMSMASRMLQLYVGALVGGQSGQATVENAAPGANVYFCYSLLGLGSFPVPGLGVTLGLIGPTLLGYTPADATGAATLWGSIPTSVPGLQLWIQAAQFGGVSNVVYTQIS